MDWQMVFGATKTTAEHAKASKAEAAEARIHDKKVCVHILKWYLPFGFMNTQYSMPRAATDRNAKTMWRA
jgi:hypothetical protein